MASLAVLTARRDALQEARDQGTKRVEFPDGSAVTYRDDAEMAAALRDLDRRIEAAASGGAGRAPIRVNTTKGV